MDFLEKQPPQVSGNSIFKKKERIFPQVSKPFLLFNSPSTVVRSFSTFLLCQKVKVAISGEEWQHLTLKRSHLGG